MTEEQKIKKRERKKAWDLKNKARIKEYYEKYHIESKDKEKKYRLKNKERLKEYHAEYRSKHKEILRKQSKEYRSKAENKEKRNKFLRDRRLVDTNFKIECLLRSRVNRVLKGYTKSAHTMELVGCSIDFAREHLQHTAIKNGYINFDINIWSGDEYHVDHIIPCSAFHLKCPVHQRLCFNWSNLQILSAYDNLSKGDKIISS